MSVNVKDGYFSATRTAALSASNGAEICVRERGDGREFFRHGAGDSFERGHGDSGGEGRPIANCRMKRRDLRLIVSNVARETSVILVRKMH